MLPRLPGSFTFTGDGFRLTWVTGSQGIVWDNPAFTMNLVDDLYATIAAAALNTTVENGASAPTQRRLFWIKRVVLKVTVTNQSQNDCKVICHPWTSRYTMAGTPSGPWGSPDFVTSHALGASATNSTAATVYGATPYMYEYITQAVKLSKPQVVALQGGQHKTFTLPYSKKYMFNDAVSGYGANEWLAGKTRGLIFTMRANTTNGVTNPNVDIGYGSGSCIFARTLSYEYESCIVPQQFRDTDLVPYTATGGERIILPQTGVVTTGVSIA